MNQLTSELSTETPAPSVNNSYAYDLLGNRTSANWGGPTTTYTTNSLNQYTDYTTDGQGTTNLNYDYNGNLTQNGSTAYGYDEQDRLNLVILHDAQTGSNSHKTEFVYDAFSRKRIAREYSLDADNGVWVPQSETRRASSERDVVRQHEAMKRCLPFPETLKCPA